MCRKLSMIAIVCFVIDMGMSLDQLKRSCKAVIEWAEDTYLIIPPNPNDLYDTYLVKIHPLYGVYLIKAISKPIDTNSPGTELTAGFNNLVSILEREYGKYHKEDIFVVWDESSGATLPNNIKFIRVDTKLLRRYIGYVGYKRYAGYLVLSYASTNYTKIRIEREELNSITGELL